MLQLYLDHFSNYNPQEFKIVFLDNGAFHKAKDLRIPSNIALFFLPPYSPELNPAEMMWRHLKDKLANVAFASLDILSDKVALILKSLTADTIKSITSFDMYCNKYNAYFK